MGGIEIKSVIAKNSKQAEAEVVPSSSSVQLGLRLGLRLRLRLVLRLRLGLRLRLRLGLRWRSI